LLRVAAEYPKEGRQLLLLNSPGKKDLLHALHKHLGSHGGKLAVFRAHGLPFEGETGSGDRQGQGRAGVRHRVELPQGALDRPGHSRMPRRIKGQILRGASETD
jgi:hypothetical protein